MAEWCKSPTGGSLQARIEEHLAVVVFHEWFGVYTVSVYRPIGDGGLKLADHDDTRIYRTDDVAEAKREAERRVADLVAIA
ncbi:MAG: hypothetical protein AAGF71_06060 [Pseudomonadota bacterium]